MKTLVLYDSAFGNTQQIAKAIGATLNASTETPVVRIKDVLPEHLSGIELLVVGSPTRGFRPSEDTKKFLQKLPARCLAGVKVAAFDTRVNIKEVNSGFLTFMVNLFGYAAEPIAKALQKKGGNLLRRPKGSSWKTRKARSNAVSWSELLPGPTVCSLSPESFSAASSVSSRADPAERLAGLRTR